MFDFVDDINKSYFPAKKSQQIVSFVDSASEAGTPSYSDQETLNKIYENLELVYRCVFMEASNIARLPKKIFRKDAKDNRVDVTDLFPIFLKPNQNQTAIDFWIESVSRSVIQGEMFWEIVENSIGYPEELFADWRSEEIEIKNKDSMITGFRRNLGNSVTEFSPEEVFYMKNFNPMSKFRGLSPLQPSRHSVELDLNAINFNKKFFKQGMKINGVLQTEQELEDKAAKRLRREFEKIYGGIDNMHKTAVLHSGLSFTPLNDMSLTDAQFLELRKMNRENISVAFGTPLEILGIGKSTYQNEKYARKKYWTETLIPEIIRMQEAITTFLLPKLVKNTKTLNYVFEFDISNVEALKEDRSQKIKDYFLGYKMGALTTNDVRVDVFGKDAYKGAEFDIPPSQQPKTFPDHECGDGIKKKKIFY